MASLTQVIPSQHCLLQYFIDPSHKVQVLILEKILILLSHLGLVLWLGYTPYEDRYCFSNMATYPCYYLHNLKNDSNLTSYYNYFDLRVYYTNQSYLNTYYYYCCRQDGFVSIQVKYVVNLQFLFTN